MEGGYGADEDIDECDDDNHDHGDATGSFYILSWFGESNWWCWKTLPGEMFLMDAGLWSRGRMLPLNFRERNGMWTPVRCSTAIKRAGRLVIDLSLSLLGKRQHHHIDKGSCSGPICPLCRCLLASMELFGMYYCRLGIVCQRCQCLIPQSTGATLHKSHARTAGTCRMADYKFVATHILRLHNLTVFWSWSRLGIFGAVGACRWARDSPEGI